MSLIHSIHGGKSFFRNVGKNSKKAFQHWPVQLYPHVSGRTRRKMKIKSKHTITPGITTTVGKCLGICSKKLSAIKSIYGLMVWNSDITDATLDRLAHLHDSIVHTTVGSKVCDMGKRVDVLIAKWDAQLKVYGIVVDNVHASEEINIKTLIINVLISPH